MVRSVSTLDQVQARKRLICPLWGGLNKLNPICWVIPQQTGTMPGCIWLPCLLLLVESHMLNFHSRGPSAFFFGSHARNRALWACLWFRECLSLPSHSAGPDPSDADISNQLVLLFWLWESLKSGCLQIGFLNPRKSGVPYPQVRAGEPFWGQVLLFLGPQAAKLQLQSWEDRVAGKGTDTLGPFGALWEAKA